MCAVTHDGVGNALMLSMTQVEKIKYVAKVAILVWNTHANKFDELRITQEDFVQNVFVRCSEVGWDNLNSGKGLSTYVTKLARSLAIKLLSKRSLVDYVEHDSEVLELNVTPMDETEFLSHLWECLPTKPVCRGHTYRDIIERFLESSDWEYSVGTKNWTTIGKVQRAIKGFIRYAGQNL